MTRHSSASAVDTVSRAESARSGATSSNAMTRIEGEEEYKPDLRWQVRLQELEYKLKAEREARKREEEELERMKREVWGGFNER